MATNVLSGSLLVGYNFSEANKGVLVVGKKSKGEAVEVINAFQGEKAYELFKTLTTKEEDKDNEKNEFGNN